MECIGYTEDGWGRPCKRTATVGSLCATHARQNAREKKAGADYTLAQERARRDRETNQRIKDAGYPGDDFSD